MKRTLALALLLAACGGKLPETRYYQLASTAPPAAESHDNAGVSLAVAPLDTDQAYDDERIVYRVTPYRLDYYNYHRWSAAPGTLVADYLERAFERSGRFRSVVRESTAAAPVTLGGRVVALEEVDKSRTEWLGRIVIELTLTDTSSGEVLWAQQYEETEPLTAQNPEGLARALSSALKRIADRALPVVSDLAVEQARARDAAKATASRSARLKP
ncbi:MAG: hypothetical protein HOV81_20745 [Kofleriaceae bacterium]|nr:hypothetical protein [Kofleriaceae bacterium]